MSFNKKIIDSRESQDWKEVQSVPLPSPSLKNIDFSKTSKLKLINQERPDIHIQDKPHPEPKQKTEKVSHLKNIDSETKSQSPKKQDRLLKKLKKQSIHYNQILSQKTKHIQIEEKAKYQSRLKGLEKKYQNQLIRLKSLIDEKSQKNEKQIQQLNLQKQAEKLYLEESHAEALSHIHQKNKNSLQKLKEIYHKKIRHFHAENKKKIRALRKEVKTHSIKEIFRQKKISHLTETNQKLSKNIKQIASQLHLKAARIHQIEAEFKKTLSKTKYDYEAQIHSLQLLSKTKKPGPDSAKLKVSYESKIQELEAQKEIIKNFEAKLYALKLQHKEELREIRENSSTKNLKKNYEEKLSTALSKHHSEVIQLNSEHRLQTELLKKNYDAHIHHLKSEFFNQTQNIKAQSEAILTKNSEDQQKLESQLTSQEAENKTFSEKLKQLQEEKEKQHLKNTQTEENYKTLLEKINFLESQNKGLNTQIEATQTQLEKSKKEALHYKEKTLSTEKTLEESKADLSAQFYKEKVEIRNQSETHIQKLQLEFHKEKLSWIEQSEKKEQEFVKKHTEDKAQMTKDFTTSIAALKKEQNSLIERIKSDHQKHTKEVCYDLKEAIEDNKEKYEQRILNIQKEASSRIAEIKTTHEKVLSSLSKEMEQALLDEKKKNTELVELYDRDTVQIQKELISLQTRFKNQEQDVIKWSSENKVLNKRVSTLISENKNFKDQNEALQFLSNALKKELEEKIKRIASLQKLNQHISQALFKAKKTEKAAAHNIDNTQKKNPLQHHDLVSKLHLY